MSFVSSGKLISILYPPVRPTRARASCTRLLAAEATATQGQVRRSGDLFRLHSPARRVEATCSLQPCTRSSHSPRWQHVATLAPSTPLRALSAPIAARRGGGGGGRRHGGGGGRGGDARSNGGGGCRHGQAWRLRPGAGTGGHSPFLSPDKTKADGWSGWLQMVQFRGIVSVNRSKRNVLAGKPILPGPHEPPLPGLPPPVAMFGLGLGHREKVRRNFHELRNIAVS